MDELVFVYDPIILEGPLNTHLIDWGHMGWNTQAVAYLTRGRKMSPMFHTFFFPVKKVCPLFSSKAVSYPSVRNGVFFRMAGITLGR